MIRQNVTLCIAMYLGHGYNSRHFTVKMTSLPADELTSVPSVGIQSATPTPSAFTSPAHQKIDHLYKVDAGIMSHVSIF